MLAPRRARADGTAGSTNKKPEKPLCGTGYIAVPIYTSYDSSGDPHTYYRCVYIGPAFALGGGLGDGGVAGAGGSEITASNTASTDPTKTKDPGCHDGTHPIQTSHMAETLAVNLFSVPGEMGLRYSLYYVSPRGWYDNLGYWLDETCGGPIGGGGPLDAPDHITVQPPGQFPPPSNPPCDEITFHRPDGSSLVFAGTPGTVGNYPEEGGGLATLVENSDYSYTVHDENGDTLQFNSAGGLESIEDAAGIGWTLSASTSGNTVIETVTHTDGQSFTIARNATIANGIITTRVTVSDPAGHAYEYVQERPDTPQALAHHIGFQLASLTLPGSPATTITYQYQAPPAANAPVLMTAVDYNGAPYFDVTYDADDRATGEHNADGSEAYSIGYTVDGSSMTAAVTNPLGHTTTKQFQEVAGEYMLTSLSEDAVATCGATTRSYGYDGNGFLTQQVDDDGHEATYSYAASGLLMSKTEAAGTPDARTTDYT